MRSRTEMVTTTLEGSDFEEDTDLDDSEEDWKPEKNATRGSRVPKVVSGRSTKRKQTSGGSAALPKKSKKGSDSDDDDDEEEESEISSASEDLTSDDEPIKKLVGSKTKARSAPVKEKDNSNENGSNGSTEENMAIQRPLQRKVGGGNRNFPDRHGMFELLVCKSELKDGFKDNKELSLWRRDGASLMQKYIRDDKEKESDVILFKSTSVYSCWEERKRRDYYEVKVQCTDEIQIGKVKILNIDELEKISETLHTDDEDVEDESPTPNSKKNKAGKDKLKSEDDADEENDEELKDEEEEIEDDEDDEEDEDEEEEDVGEPEE